MSSIRLSVTLFRRLRIWRGGRRLFVRWSLVLRGLVLRSRDLLLRIHLRHRDELVALIDLDQSHAGGVSAGLADFAYACADEDAALGDEDGLVVVGDELHADDFAVALVGVDVDDAAGAAALDRVILQRRAFAVAVDARGKNLGLGVVAAGHDQHGDDLVALALEARAGHAARGAAHRADLRFVEANRQAALGPQDHVVLAAGAADVDERVAFLQTDRDDAVRADVRIGAQGRLLHDALCR